MTVRDLLRVKGTTLFPLDPDARLIDAIRIMAEHDLGSLVIMNRGQLSGVLTFREIIKALHQQHGELGQASVKDAIETHPMT